jgi:hypothetical protein
MCIIATLAYLNEFWFIFKYYFKSELQVCYRLDATKISKNNFKIAKYDFMQ